MKVQFKRDPKMQYEVLREGIGYCDFQTEIFGKTYELNNGMEVSIYLMEEAKGELPDFIDVHIKLLDL